MHWFSLTDMKLKCFISRQSLQNSRMVSGYKIENTYPLISSTLITNEKPKTTKVRVERYYSQVHLHSKY